MPGVELRAALPPGCGRLSAAELPAFRVRRQITFSYAAFHQILRFYSLKSPSRQGTHNESLYENPNRLLTRRPLGFQEILEPHREDITRRCGHGLTHHR